MDVQPRLAWADGRIVPLDDPRLRFEEGAAGDRPGCYTTARWQGGRVRHGRRSARRLVRDAKRLGLGPLDEVACLQAMQELGARCFGAGSGVLRFDAGVDAAGRFRVLGTARPVGPEPESWRAITSRCAHEGPGPTAGVKRSGQPWLERAREEVRAANLDEGLLFDREQRLVEGTRSNLFVCRADGVLVTPPLERGGVAGVARAILLERLPEIAEQDSSVAEIQRARELVAVNGVRGARPVVELDGAPLGGGRPGPWSTRLGQLLDAER